MRAVFDNKFHIGLCENVMRWKKSMRLTIQLKVFFYFVIAVPITLLYPHHPGLVDYQAIYSSRKSWALFLKNREGTRVIVRISIWLSLLGTFLLGQKSPNSIAQNLQEESCREVLICYTLCAIFYAFASQIDMANSQEIPVRGNMLICFSSNSVSFSYMKTTFMLEELRQTLSCKFWFYLKCAHSPIMRRELLKTLRTKEPVL